AWIIGWDLILEYAVSNMAVSVGFSAHIVGLLDWFGLHPDPRWISPAYLPGGLSDLQGNMLYLPGWHFWFNWPAFIMVMLFTVIFVGGIKESARRITIMLLLKFVPIMVFVVFAANLIHPLTIILSRQTVGPVFSPGAPSSSLPTSDSILSP